MTSTVLALSTRAFPPPAPDLYKSAEPGSILALGNARMSLWGRLAGLSLGNLGKVSRMLSFHRLALQSELEGKTSRADFYWIETQRQLYKIRQNREIWREGIGSTNISPALRDEAMQLLIRQVFIDTHLTLMQSYLRQESASTATNRGFVHLDYARVLTDMTELEDEEKEAI